MKKLSGVFICLLLFTFISSARIIEVADAGITDKLKAVIAAKNAGGAPACETNSDACSEASVGSNPMASDGGNYYWATKFQASESTTICAAILYLEKVGAADPTHSYVVSVRLNTCSTCDRSDDNVGAITGTASTNTLTWNDLTAAETAETFTGMSASITSGEFYWISIATTGTADASNYGQWHKTESCTVEDVHKDGDGAGTWGSESSGSSSRFQLLK